jgi:hypothetical protein
MSLAVLGKDLGWLLFALSICACNMQRNPTLSDATVPAPRPLLGKGVDVAVVLSGPRDGTIAVHFQNATLVALVERLHTRGIDFRLGITSSTLDREAPGMCGVVAPPRRAEFIRPPVEPPENWVGAWPPPALWSPELARRDDLGSLLYHYTNEALKLPHCEITQYLETAFATIDGRNADFPREGSLLVLLIVSTREDCSTSDHSLWDPKNGWTDEFHANARCTKPPAGLLYPVERYVDRLADIHASGPILAFVVGSNAPAIYETYPYPLGETAQWVVPECTVPGVVATPATRLVAFVSNVERKALPGVSALFEPVCPSLVAENGTAIADRLVKEIAARIQ